MCEEAHNLYTKAKDNLIEASGGTDCLPQELTSIRSNFIEQLKKEFDLNISNDEEQEQPDTEPEPIPPVIFNPKSRKILWLK